MDSSIHGGGFSLMNDILCLSYDPEAFSLQVLDRRIGKTWRQEPFAAGLRPTHALAEPDRLVLSFSAGAVPFALTYALEGAEVTTTLSGPLDAPMDRVPMPAFVAPDARHFLLQTDGGGLLLSVDDDEYPEGEYPVYYCGGGPGMAWAGMVDDAMAGGFMAIFESPFDTAVAYRRAEGRRTFSPALLPSKGVLGYARCVRYVFFDQGGYVAQCKRYRVHAWPRGGVTPLRERLQRFPALSRLLGAVHVYLWDQARTVEFVRRMRQDGIGKALVLWDANHVPYPPEGFDDAVRELGYATGAYELFSDIHRDDHPESTTVCELPLKRNVYPGLFDTLAARTAGGGTYSNEFGTYVCPEAIRGEMVRRVERELATYPHDTYFLDVYQANGLYECWHPDHPLSREGWANRILENATLLEDKYGVYLGGEFGADFAASKSCYVHGMMTLQRTWFNTDADREGTIWYKGDWADNARPSIMLGARTAPDLYLRYSVNDRMRVPLYELVYHDAVVTSWRWEDGNHHCPEIWWKKDLLNVVHGSAPLWSLDQERWNQYRQSFVASYQRLAPWLGTVCTEEMLSHRCLDNDRRVHETVFSSGMRVVVNFSDEVFVHEDITVGPRDFRWNGIP